MQVKFQRRGLFAAAGLVLAACAAQPVFETTGTSTELSPREAAKRAEAAEGSRVIWGGVIVSSTNLEQASQIEVLAYPLDSSQRPRTSQPPTGRFLARREGYLETLDFGRGRQVTVTGPVTGTEAGKVGDSRYVYPVVAAEGLHLWPRRTDPDGSSRVHFGVGIGVIVR